MASRPRDLKNDSPRESCVQLCPWLNRVPNEWDCHQHPNIPLAQGCRTHGSPQKANMANKEEDQRGSHKSRLTNILQNGKGKGGKDGTGTSRSSTVDCDTIDNWERRIVAYTPEPSSKANGNRREQGSHEEQEAKQKSNITSETNPKTACEPHSNPRHSIPPRSGDTLTGGKANQPVLNPPQPRINGVCDHEDKIPTPTYRTRATRGQLIACARAHPGHFWSRYDFKEARRFVEKLQHRILKSFRNGQHNKVKRLQRTLTRSLPAFALAVKKVTDSKGSRTPGIDGARCKTKSSKGKLVHLLSSGNYIAKPLRHKMIPKPGKDEVRSLGIPVILDRVMQTVHSMALAPIAEHTADHHSYGFRGYLGVTDAVEQVRTAVSGQNAPRWILDADIKGCFDNISHNWMIEGIPMDKSILNQWLKCGYYDEKGHYTPTIKGTPQGGVISPLLCNIVLDGLEQVVINAAGSDPKVHIIRYADDFIVTAPDKELLEQNIIPAIEAFLAERGLALHPEKTRIVQVDDGFNFLGHHFVGTPNGKLRITPSRVKINAFLTQVGMLVNSYCDHGLYKLFQEVLNPRIQGWAKSYQTIHAKEAYDYVDKKIHHIVMKHLLRLLPSLSKKQILEKYVVPTRGGRTFAIPCPAGGVDKDGERKLVRLFKASSLRKVAHEKAPSRVNAFDPDGKLTLEKRRKRNRIKKRMASRDI